MSLFHLFKTPKYPYLYDVNTNSIFRINSTLAAELMEYRNSGYNSVSPGVTRLKKQGILSEKAEFFMEHPMTNT